MKPRFIDEKNMEKLWGDCSQLCGIMCVVCFMVFLKSCVYCQALAEGLKENSTLTNLNLENNNIGPEGAK